MGIKFFDKAFPKQTVQNDPFGWIFGRGSVSGSWSDSATADRLGIGGEIQDVLDGMKKFGNSLFEGFHTGKGNMYGGQNSAVSNPSGG